MSRVLLMLLALIGVVLTMALQHFAAPHIQAAREAATERALLDLLPPGSYDNRPLQAPLALPDAEQLVGKPTAIGYLARQRGQPSAVLLPVSAVGYEGPIQLLLAISPDGRLLATKVLQQEETPGIADLLAPARQRWLQGFVGRRADAPAARWTLTADGGDVDQIAGATLTSRAVTQALQRALRYYQAERTRLLEARP